MKSIKLLIFVLFLVFVFPAFSTAEPMDDAAAAVDAKDWDKAFELLTPLAEENNLLAKTLLGTLYIRGQGVDMDATKGLSLIMDAAKQGNDMARGLAAVYQKELAESGDVKAMYNTAYMCLNGWTGDIDPNVCLKWHNVLGNDLKIYFYFRLFIFSGYSILYSRKSVAANDILKIFFASSSKIFRSLYLGLW